MVESPTNGESTARRFRKKFSLALMLFAAGTYIAITSDATLGEYTYFGAMLLSIFGAADLVDKGKIGPLNK